MNSSNSRLRLLIGVPVLIMGAGLVVFSYRVLASFFLDLVVQTLRKKSDPPLEPYDFPWGTMHWGRSAEDFTYLCVGLLLLALAHLMIVPHINQRLGSANVVTSNHIPKLAMILSFVASLIASVSFLFIALIIKSAFGTLSVSGAADPISLASDLPFLTSRIFMISLVSAQVLLIIAVLALPKSNPTESAPGSKALALASCASLFLFTLLMFIARLGPIRAITDVIQSSSLADPSELAGHVTLLIYLFFFGAFLIAAHAILFGIVAFSKSKSNVTS